MKKKERKNIRQVFKCISLLKEIQYFQQTLRKKTIKQTHTHNKKNQKNKTIIKTKQKQQQQQQKNKTKQKYPKTTFTLSK